MALMKNIYELKLSGPGRCGSDLYVVVFVLSSVFLAVIGQYSSSGASNKQTIYVTSKAAGKMEELWCYSCDTMEQDEGCVEVKNTTFQRKCSDDHRICSVKQIVYTTSTENGTTVSKMWSLARNCSHKCEAGCIVVGERTKLHACTACCETTLCNSMKSGGGARAAVDAVVLVAVFVAAAAATGVWDLPWLAPFAVRRLAAAPERTG